jgi:hypothetical protein
MLFVIILNIINHLDCTNPFVGDKDIIKKTPTFICVSKIENKGVQE